MVKLLLLAPVVSALVASDANKPVSAIATHSKWTRPKQHKAVCGARVRSLSSKKLSKHTTGTVHPYQGHGKGKHHKHGNHSALMQFPGAGMKPKDIEPFDRVLKDGFMKVNCIKDAMFSHGDKFGANKHEYKYGPTANVSIVHYDAHVAKEDREKMTPEVCYNFCRSVEDMLYFGIVNGRDCYCTPYFKQMASNSDSCDAVCEGDTSQTCGGKSKSNLWEMHMCNDAAQTLAEAAFIAKSVKHQIDYLVPKAKSAAAGKQELGEEFQAAFGQAGDPEAANLMQKAKGAAGNLEHLAEDCDEDGKKLGKLIDDITELTGFNYGAFINGVSREDGTIRQAITDYLDEDKVEKFLEFDTAKAGDDLLAEIQEFMPKANATFAELTELYLLSEPVLTSSLIMRYGECNLDEKTGCITPQLGFGMDYYSGGDEETYYYGDWCEFEIIGGTADVLFKNMETERNWDGFWVYSEAGGHQFYSGQESENTFEKGLKVVGASGYMYWMSDWWVQKPGFEVCVSTGGEQGNEGIQYYPLMYFVDKEFAQVPTTCSGDLIGSPIYYKNYHGCAAACDADNQNCVAFGYYPTGKGKPNMCFLFSKLKSAQYYTGCDSDEGPPLKLHQHKSKSFLQLESSDTQPITEEPAMAVCALKLSKFVGTNLTPDPSGKNDFKLKELTKADRCYETPSV